MITWCAVALAARPDVLELVSELPASSFGNLLGAGDIDADGVDDLVVGE